MCNASETVKQLPENYIYGNCVNCELAEIETRFSLPDMHREPQLKST